MKQLRIIQRIIIKWEGDVKNYRSRGGGLGLNNNFLKKKRKNLVKHKFTDSRV